MDFTQLMQQGADRAWVYIPFAVLLGALHGLEPGHSKAMMAAFIIAIRGTVRQAVLLGLSAAISHSLIIWALAALALKFGSRWSADTTEPYFQLFSAAVILAMAVWMFLRTRRDARAEAHHHHHHHHDEHGRTIDTGHGIVTFAIFEDGVPPVFRVQFSEHGRSFVPDPATISVVTTRSEGATQEFKFAACDGYLESTEEIPEPHDFRAAISISHGDHAHVYNLSFHEDDHGHAHHHEDAPEFQDAHEAAHAADIEKRFSDRSVTTWQIILFGLTGGLMPCPAAFSVLIVCLQVKQYTLGFALVAAFSLGLALIMVTVGAAAAISVRHAEKRFKGFDKIMRRAPYVSCSVLVIIGAYMLWNGWTGLQRLH